MNRSLLIVICDFIVSAMLSMLSGMPSEQAVASNGVPLDSHTAATVVEQLHQEQVSLEAARQELLKKLSLPEHLTANALLEALNLLYDRESFWHIVQEDL